MPVSKKLFPSRYIDGATGESVAYEDRGRAIFDRLAEDHLTPEQRLAEHKASKVPGPHGNTVRLRLRLIGDERPLVRSMYDRTSKPKRKKGGKS